MTERTELLHGPYSLPPVKTGDKVFCAARDRQVACGGLVECPIGPWPRVRKTGRPALILCGELIRAVKSEAEIAVAHWWGVHWKTVLAWRKALGVGRITSGTKRLLARNAEEYRSTEACYEVLRREANTLEHRQAASDRLRGKPAHPRTKKGLLRASKRKWTPKRCRERSKEMSRRVAFGEIPTPPMRPTDRPWRPEEETLLGTTLDKHVAKMLGRTLAAVRSRRALLGIPMSRHSRLHIGNIEENRKKNAKSREGKED